MSYRGIATGSLMLRIPSRLPPWAGNIGAVPRHLTARIAKPALPVKGQGGAMSEVHSFTFTWVLHVCPRREVSSNTEGGRPTSGRSLHVWGMQTQNSRHCASTGPRYMLNYYENAIYVLEVAQRKVNRG